MIFCLHLQSGDFRQLGIQALAVVSICAWATITSLVFLKVIQLTVGLRVSLEEEIIGSDIVEHAVGGLRYNKKTRMIESDSATHEEPDIIRHHDQPNTTFQRRQSHVYGRRQSGQSGSYIESVYNHLSDCQNANINENSKRNLFLSIFETIANKCKRRNKHIDLFSPNDYVNPKPSTDPERGISTTQIAIQYPSLPFRKNTEELDERDTTVTYV